MVMNGGGRGVALLSSEEGGACGIILLVWQRAHLLCFPMCCRFQGIPST